ncbi:MAG: rhodanese-like domain-containing protein [Alphaproteobacteria bacterium]
MPSAHRILTCSVVACLLLLVPAADGDQPEIKKIDFSALVALIDSGVPHLLVDTRAPKSYQQGHIPTAVNIPGYLFERELVPGLPADRKKPVIAYCSGGHCGVSWFAAERLIDLGYEHVLVFNDGVDGWKQRGQMLITARHEKLPRINKADLGALIATGAVVRLLDARGPALFTIGTIDGAVNLPVDKCRPGAEGMPPSLDELVVVFGQGKWDGHAYHVADRLLSWGYKKVKIFVGGLNEWRRS